MRALPPIALLLAIACSTLAEENPGIQVAAPTGDPAQDRANLVAAFADAEPGDTIRFAAGTYQLGEIVRVQIPDLTLLGHPDGTILRGGDGYDDDEGEVPGGNREADVDALGILHLFEGGCTVRGLVFEDSWWGLLLGWHYGYAWDEREPDESGGFVVEGNRFRNSQNGVRGTNSGERKNIVRGNVFENAHFGVSTLGSGWVIEGNHFRMPDAPRAQGHGAAVRMSAEHVAGGCSENAVLDNIIQGHETGVAIYTDGRRTGTGNTLRGNRIELVDGERSFGVELYRRAETGSPRAPTGGVIGTVIAENHITGASQAAISVGEGCDDSRVANNAFGDLIGPAILIGGNRTRITGHAAETDIRYRTTASPRDDARFPTAQSEDIDLDFEDLAWLSEEVGHWAESGEIVGAEILIIRGGKTLLHDVYGWSDREEGRRLERGSIYRMRSMTKPFTGTTVLQLVADGKLGLDDPVAKYLPSFDNERARGITVRQLLTHTAGLREWMASFVLAQGVPENGLRDFLHGLDGQRELVDMLGAEGVTETPGEYLYSDLGSATLGELVAQVSGKPAAQVIHERVLEPLGMRDSHTFYSPDAPWRPRMNPSYEWIDETAEFVRYWDPSQEQAPPFFRSSGGLYSTVHDYARFAAAWLHGGALGGARILPEPLAKEALKAHAERSELSGYGYHWTVSKARSDGMPRLFGHGGSDGTRVWVFPETETIVLYFSQSRDHAMRSEFMARLGFILPEFDFMRDALPKSVSERILALRGELPASRLADAGEVRLEYFQFGDAGPAVVFVQDHHDYFRLPGAEMWGEFLARFGDDYQVIAPVRRGWGQSEDPGEGYDVATQARDILGLLDALDIEQAYFVGRTLATHEMTWIAENHPERVLGLAYRNTPMFVPPDVELTEEMRLFHRMYARTSTDIGEAEEVDRRLQRGDWEPRFLRDEDLRIDLPVLLTQHPVADADDVAWDTWRLDRIEAWTPEQQAIWADPEARAYVEALRADPERMAALRRSFEAGAANPFVRDALRRTYGDRLTIAWEQSPLRGSAEAMYAETYALLRPWLDRVTAASR